MNKIIVVTDDLIFKTRIDIILQSLNMSVNKYNCFHESDFDSMNGKRTLMIVDLENEKMDFSKISKLKKEHGRKIYLLSYCSHVKSNLMLSASNSGFDEVVPRSKFIKILPDFLKNFDKLDK